MSWEKTVYAMIQIQLGNFLPSSHRLCHLVVVVLSLLNGKESLLNLIYGFSLQQNGFERIMDL